jgi:beta-glucuronidase
MEASGKDKLKITLEGTSTLPSYSVKNYKLFLSAGEKFNDKDYNIIIPDILQGQKVSVEIENKFKGQGYITIVRPTGFVVINRKVEL